MNEAVTGFLLFLSILIGVGLFLGETFLPPSTNPGVYMPGPPDGVFPYQ